MTNEYIVTVTHTDDTRPLKMLYKTLEAATVSFNTAVSLVEYDLLSGAMFVVLHSRVWSEEEQRVIQTTVALAESTL